jgi:RNA polymerase sigma-70 factor (ECF subfamily)
LTTPDHIAHLITRVAASDRAAFDELYSHTSAKLFGVCLRVLNDRASAEDALQDVFVKIWQRADRFKVGGYSPMSWLITIARNHAIDVVRARAPQPVDGAADIDDAVDIKTEEKTPEQMAVNESEGRAIDKCFDELAEGRADAVRSAYVEGYSYQELAERHDVPVNTMRTWLRRSLIQLRECLER